MQQRQIVTVLELGWRGGHYVDTTPKELNFSNMCSNTVSGLAATDAGPKGAIHDLRIPALKQRLQERPRI